MSWILIINFNGNVVIRLWHLCENISIFVQQQLLLPYYSKPYHIAPLLPSVWHVFDSVFHLFSCVSSNFGWSVGWSFTNWYFHSLKGITNSFLVVDWGNELMPRLRASSALMLLGMTYIFWKTTFLWCWECLCKVAKQHCIAFPIVHCIYEELLSRKKFKTDSNTFFATKNFRNRYRYHQQNWKSFETEKFRNRRLCEEAHDDTTSKVIMNVLPSWLQAAVCVSLTPQIKSGPFLCPAFYQDLGPPPCMNPIILVASSGALHVIMRHPWPAAAGSFSMLIQQSL